MSDRRDPRLGHPDWSDNWTVGPGFRMEIIDSDGRVWLCQDPVTKEQARNLALPEGASHALFVAPVADAAFFRRSPDADADGPLDAMELDGLRFSFVARQAGRRQVEGATILSIDKHHSLLYAAGRTIELLDFGDGTFASPAWSRPDHEIGKPAVPGWTRRDVELTDDLIVIIPNPADVVIFADGFGFHGPLALSQLESATR